MGPNATYDEPVIEDVRSYLFLIELAEEIVMVSMEGLKLTRPDNVYHLWSEDKAEVKLFASGFHPT